MPFTEAVGAIVLLTSDGLLKWLIGLNLFALLAIAIMVVPEKENWRHVFDLTRFRERPTKLDPSQYQRRTGRPSSPRSGNSTTLRGTISLGSRPLRSCKWCVNRASSNSSVRPVHTPTRN